MRCFSLGRMEIRMFLRRGDIGNEEDAGEEVGTFSGVRRGRKRWLLRFESSPVCFSSAVRRGEEEGGAESTARVGLSSGAKRRLLEVAKSALETIRWVLSTPSGQEQVLCGEVRKERLDKKEGGPATGSRG
jgi:hypothetical protein